MALHTSGDKGDESAQVKSDFLKYLSELSGPSSSNLYLQIVRTATFTHLITHLSSIWYYCNCLTIAPRSYLTPDLSSSLDIMFLSVSVQ